MGVDGVKAARSSISKIRQPVRAIQHLENPVTFDLVNYGSKC